MKLQPGIEVTRDGGGIWDLQYGIPNTENIVNIYFMAVLEFISGGNVNGYLEYSSYNM